MLFLDSYECIKWKPNLSSSGLTSPKWTKLVCKGVKLCNSIEDVDWGLVNSVQVELCDSCGTVGCANGGYIDISRFGDFLLWTKPNNGSNDPLDKERYAPFWELIKHGPVIIPIEKWNKLREDYNNLPSPTKYPESTRADIANAWLLEEKGFEDIFDLYETLSIFKEKLVASDAIEVPDVIEIINFFINWVISEPKAKVSGMLEKVNKSNVLTLYFDDPKIEDWPALIIKNGKIFLGLREEWLFDVKELQFPGNFGQR